LIPKFLYAPIHSSMSIALENCPNGSILRTKNKYIYIYMYVCDIEYIDTEHIDNLARSIDNKDKVN